VEGGREEGRERGFDKLSLECLGVTVRVDTIGYRTAVANVTIILVLVEEAHRIASKEGRRETSRKEPSTQHRIMPATGARRKSMGLYYYR